jgi:hypothetical protein
MGKRSLITVAAFVGTLGLSGLGLAAVDSSATA